MIRNMTTWTSRNIAVVTTIVLWHQWASSLLSSQWPPWSLWCFREEREWLTVGYVFEMPCKCQMAVSQNTVVWVGYGGGRIFLVPPFFPQLGRTDVFSCLHWLRSWCLSSFLSGRGGGGLSRDLCKCGCCLERISMHRVRFLSICSSIVVSPHIHGIWGIWATHLTYHVK